MFSGKLVEVRPTVEDQLPLIINIEKTYSDNIGQNNIREHKQFIKKEHKAHYSVFVKSTEELIGYFLLDGIDNAIETIELKRIAITHKGKGYGKDTLQIIKHICFEELDTYSLWLDVFETNNRALNLYASCGFKIIPDMTEWIKHEGIMRKLLIMKCIKYPYEIAI